MKLLASPGNPLGKVCDGTLMCTITQCPCSQYLDSYSVKLVHHQTTVKKNIDVVSSDHLNINTST